jgi:general secretion pathway protein K
MMRRQSGIALVLVLWVITLLSVIAGNFAFSMRGEAQIARNLLATAQAQALADAGVQRAWFELMKPTTDLKRWQGDGMLHEFMVDGTLLRISILDESGKIDLNTASDSLLQGLFKSMGLGEDGSVALLDAILDWRDADKLKRLHGAEEDEYRSVGKSYGPSNAPFETVEELARVLGMDAELYRKLAPALTVYSKQPGVNTAVASSEVFLAIPGVNAGIVEQYLAQRLTLIATGQPPPAFAGAGPFGSGPSGLSAYMVRSEAKMADGTVFVRKAVARLAQDPKRPITLLAWGEGDADQLTGK